MSKKKENPIEVDEKAAALIAHDLVKVFNGWSIQDSKTVLNAVTIALVTLVNITGKQVHTNADDGLERMVLDWMSRTDSQTKLNFSKYINVNPKESQDNEK